MDNQALPAKSYQLLQRHGLQCKNLSLILDKFVPWGIDRGTWDLRMKESVRRRGETSIQIVSGGQAKGLWLSTFRSAKRGESPSLFEEARYDLDLIDAYQKRWVQHIKDSDGIAFEMQLSERMAAGLGASSVLETSLTLDRNTGLPYLPGSSVKGLARAWGLIETASLLGIALDDTVTRNKETVSVLNELSEILAGRPYTSKRKEEKRLEDPLEEQITDITNEATYNYKEVKPIIEAFQLVFGSQANAGAVAFLDAIYIEAEAPRFATDVMTPHYVNYFTGNGSSPPAEDDNPNPVSFLTVDAGNKFAFGLVPRHYGDDEQVNTALDIAQEWLSSGLTRLGAGAKTTAGYGFFRPKSKKLIVGG